MRILFHRLLNLPYLQKRHLKYVIPHGEAIDFSNQRVCLFSHYDKHSQLDDHVIHYMRSLKEVGLSVVLISSNMDLSKESLGIAKTMCSAVILRENRGWDFAGWALGITTLNGMYNASEIVIANDSVYGPMHPISEMFDFMNERPCDLWSVTESFEIDWHLQSYFLVFKRSAIASDCFRRFWENVRILRTKHGVIIHYEIKLARFFCLTGSWGRLMYNTRENCITRIQR